MYGASAAGASKTAVYGLSVFKSALGVTAAQGVTVSCLAGTTGSQVTAEAGTASEVVHKASEAAHKVSETAHKVSETAHKVSDAAHKVSETAHKASEAAHKVPEAALKASKAAQTASEATRKTSEAAQKLFLDSPQSIFETAHIASEAAYNMCLNMGIDGQCHSAEKKRLDYTFWRQCHEKPSIIPGYPGVTFWCRCWTLWQRSTSGMRR